jgi:hypothetical protein
MKRDYPSFLLIQKDYNRPSGKVVRVESFQKLCELIITQNYTSGFINPPRRSLHNWRKTNILVLDIDEKQDFSMKELSSKLKNICHIIAPTKSNMIKKSDKEACERYRLLLITSEYIKNAEDYKEIAIKFAEKYELKIDHKAIDACHFFYASKNCEHINEVSTYLNPLDYLSAKKEIDDKCSKKWDGKYHLSSHDIPEELNSLINIQKTKPMRGKFETFIRLLMAQHNLVRTDPDTKIVIGVGRNELPQEYISNFLGVDRKTLRKWMKNLIENNYLEIANEFYGKGQKAREYRALGPLKKVIIKSYFEYVSVEGKSDDLPSHIEDGEWDKVLFIHVWKFQYDDGPERYYRWAKNLPTYNDKPEREHDVEWAWKSMKKYVSER